MQSRAVELLVGFFVCLGIAAIFILTMRVSNLADTSDVDGGYTVVAAFDNIGGLKVGDHPRHLDLTVETGGTEGL